MTRALRIFLDANILFSAAKSSGPIHSLVVGSLDAGHECWADRILPRLAWPAAAGT